MRLFWPSVVVARFVGGVASVRGRRGLSTGHGFALSVVDKLVLSILGGVVCPLVLVLFVSLLWMTVIGELTLVIVLVLVFLLFMLLRVLERLLILGRMLMLLLLHVEVGTNLLLNA